MCLQAGEGGYKCHVHLSPDVVVMATRHSSSLVVCSSHSVSYITSHSDSFRIWVYYVSRES